MILVTVVIPGIDQPHVVLAESEEDGIADALYALGMRELPTGSSVTTQLPGGYPCSSAI